MIITTKQLLALHPHLTLQGTDATANVARVTGIQRQRRLLISISGRKRQVLFWSTADHDHWRAAPNYDFVVVYRKAHVL